MPRFLANSNTKEVHDLANEQMSCQISAIEIEHRVEFESLKDARNAGYTCCQWCIESDADGSSPEPVERALARAR
jgi:hypothetical protein